MIKVGLLLLLLFAALYVLANAAGAPDLGEITGWLEASRRESRWLAAALVTGLLVLDLFLSVPTMAVTLLAGHWLGFLPGAMAASLGMGAAGILGYGISRRFGDRALAWLLREDREREALRAEFSHRGFALILFSRALPMLPEVSACLAGITGMPFPRFLAAWAAGTIPYALAAAYWGSVSSTGTHALFAAAAIWGGLWSIGFVYSKRGVRSGLHALTGLGFALALLVPVRAWTYPNDVSAVRSAGESFEQAAAREGRIFAPAVSSTKEAPVQDVAEGFLDFDPTDVPLWETDAAHGLEALSALFREIRDQRIYRDPEAPDFERRMAFLFPDDGCHVRAALFNQELEKRGFARGHKIFVFGDLRVRTAHHPNGEVLWWFHVAPIFRLKQGLTVVDPALFPQGPVRFKEWLKFLAPDGDPMRLQMVTCDPLAHTPQSRCAGGGPGMDGGAARQHAEELLSFEWTRQVRLGRDPRRILGDSPPWLPGSGVLGRALEFFYND